MAGATSTAAMTISAAAFGDGQVDYLYCRAGQARRDPDRDRARAAARRGWWVSRTTCASTSSTPTPMTRACCRPRPTRRCNRRPQGHHHGQRHPPARIVPDEVGYRMARSLIRAKGPRLAQIHGSMACLRPGGGVEVLGRAAAPGRRARLPRGRRDAGRLTRAGGDTGLRTLRGPLGPLPDGRGWRWRAPSTFISAASAFPSRSPCAASTCWSSCRRSSCCAQRRAPHPGATCPRRSTGPGPPPPPRRMPG